MVAERDDVAGCQICGPNDSPILKWVTLRQGDVLP